MKELKLILAKSLAKGDESRPLALATVVHVEGSSYRRPGARLLIGDDGILAGSVSGGCLEKDVLVRARAATVRERSVTIRYDSLDEEEEGGFGLGCRGVIDILIEPVSEVMRVHEFPFLANCLARRRAGVLAKITRVEGSVGGARLGSYLLVDSSEDAQVLLEKTELWDVQALEDALECLRARSSRRTTYRGPDGEIDVFFEVVQPATPLVVFGTGPDVLPLLRMAKELGWEVTVIDPRATQPRPGRFHEADHYCSAAPAELSERLTIPEDAAVVVMTHQYALDREILHQLLPRRFRYVGLLGPKVRADRLCETLADREVGLAAQWLANLHAPAGMDIGADTPESIALSILSEIQGKLHGREGGALRRLKGPIHPRGCK
jgi:xanthine/CO dehydrogenase XdhC/CoxF family maturation factor